MLEDPLFAAEKETILLAIGLKFCQRTPVPASGQTSICARLPPLGFQNGAYLSARPWDWQILLNGFIAERAYELKTIDTSLPFAELRRLSYIDYRARDADDDPTFSILIRKGIPGIP